MIEITKTITIVHVSCGTCGVEFGLEKSYRDNRFNSGATFYCPNGCRVCWSETEADRLRKELAGAKQDLSWQTERARRAAQDAEHFKASRNAVRGVVTRLKNRAAAGMCPCCNRHFENLERHMGTKHPDFAKADSESKDTI